MMRDYFHERHVEAEQDEFYIPQVIAQRLCLRIRADVAGKWLSPQWWACQRCTFLNWGGVPRGLKECTDGKYSCQAMAKRYGYDCDDNLN